MKKILSIGARHSTLFSLFSLYWRNKSRISDALRHEDHTLTGIWDLRASPYALGDILTWNMRLCVQAISLGKKAIDICIIADPRKPSNRYQPYITSSNYHKSLIEISPVFFYNPMLRNIHFYTSREVFESYFALKHIQRQDVSPNISEYSVDYINTLASYNSHDIINQFYSLNKYIPNFQIPMGINIWVNNFLNNFKPGTFFVCVHMRKRSNELEKYAGQDFRDAKIEHWLDFFKIVEERYPDVMFLPIGRPVEWPRELHHRRNVLIIKNMGYGLIEELALIKECDLFMGSNSGPAVIAIFGDKPYIIFQVPENAQSSAGLYGIKVGEEKLPFAKNFQQIKWSESSVELLVESFEEIYSAILTNSDQPLKYLLNQE